MLELLLSLLLFVFGLGHIDHPALDPQTIADRIEEHISEVLPPQGNPESSYQGSQEIAVNDPGEPEEEQENNQEPQDEDNLQGNDGNEENQENSADPDTTKIATYNTESEKYIGQVAAVAVENAEPLIPCEIAPAGVCDNTPQPEDLPDPVQTPIILPVVEPCPPHPIAHDNPHVMAPEIICVE